MSKKGSVILIALTMASAFGIIIGSALSSTVSQASLQKRVVANMQARQVANSAMVVAMRSLQARIDAGEQLDGQNFTIAPPDPNLYGPTTYRLSSNDAKLVQTTLAQTSQITMSTPAPMPDKLQYNRSAFIVNYTAGAYSVYRTRDPMPRNTETAGVVRNIDVYLNATVKVGGITVNTRLKQTLADRFYNSAKSLGVIWYPDAEFTSNTLDLFAGIYCMNDLYLYPIGSGAPFPLPPYTAVAGSIYRTAVFPTTNLTPLAVNAPGYMPIAAVNKSAIFPLTLDSKSSDWATRAPALFGGSVRDGKLGVKAVPLEGFNNETYIPAHKSSDGQKRNPFYKLIQPLVAQDGNDLTTDPLFNQKIVSSARCLFRVAEDGTVKFFIIEQDRNERDVTSSVPPGIIGAAAQDYSKVETDLVIEKYEEEQQNATLSQQLSALIDSAYSSVEYNPNNSMYRIPRAQSDMFYSIYQTLNAGGQSWLNSPNPVSGTAWSILLIPAEQNRPYSQYFASSVFDSAITLWGEILSNVEALERTQQQQQQQPPTSSQTEIAYVKSGLYDTRQDLSLSLITLDVQAFKDALTNRTFGPEFNPELYFSGTLYIEFPTPPPPSTRPDGVIPASSNTMALQLINCNNMQQIPLYAARSIGITTIATNAAMYVVGDVNPSLAQGISGFPCYFMADAFTFLSKAWKHESRRYSKCPIDTQEVYAVRTAVPSILGATVIAGITPTPRNSTNIAWSGGVPWGIIRPLEAWGTSLGGNSSSRIQIRGAIICLYESELQTKPLARAMYDATYKYMGQLPTCHQEGGFQNLAQREIFPIFHTYRATSSRYVSDEEFNNL